MNSFLSIENITSNELVIAVVGYLIVFLALLLLYSLFRIMPRLLYMKIRKKKVSAAEERSDEEMISGEETAAIAMALQLYLDELHDEESDVMTIKKISKRYSPWSSKIYGLNSYFQKQIR